MNVCPVLLTRSRNTPNSCHTCSGTESLTVCMHACVCAANIRLAHQCARIDVRGHLSNSGQVRYFVGWPARGVLHSPLPAYAQVRKFHWRTIARNHLNNYNSYAVAHFNLSQSTHLRVIYKFPRHVLKKLPQSIF